MKNILHLIKDTLIKSNYFRFAKSVLKHSLFYLFLLSGVCFAKSNIEQDFMYLNQLRTDAQLQPFSRNLQLADAAQNHAYYLTAAKRHGHHEQQGLRFFTGQWAAERAIAAQYPNRLVAENVTSKSGDSLYFNPVDSLMSAIYHRFGFLDLSSNEIGIGHQLGDISSYVYVMGNSHLSDACLQPSFSGYGTYNFNICVDKDKKIDKQLVDNAKQKNLITSSKVVLWPPRNARDIAPVFYQESPDPLPHHAVSGYPVSIQFNSFFYKLPPKIIAFQVRESVQKKSLKAITVMNQANDPNHKFTPFEHAFFPEKRLNWDTNYTVNIEYINQDTQQKHYITWSFHTKSFKEPIINITQFKQTVTVKARQHVILYFPPRNAQDTKSTVSSKSYNMQIQINYIDKNTLKVYIPKSGKAEIFFHNKTVHLVTK